MLHGHHAVTEHDTSAELVLLQAYVVLLDLVCESELRCPWLQHQRRACSMVPSFVSAMRLEPLCCAVV
jgi:hypothetical protein